MKSKIKLIIALLIFVLSSCIVGMISNNTENRYIDESKTSEPITEDKLEDTTNPEIILSGGEVIIYVGDEYIEPGYQVIDDIDGDITSLITIYSSVDNSKPGNYTITYLARDSSNNETIVTRNVKVIEHEKTSTVSKIDTITTFKNTSIDNEEINNYIKDLKNYLSKYKVSVGYVSINTGFTYLYNAKESYFGASLIKTVDAMYVYENGITDSEVLKKVKKLISKSDNDAHAYLVKKFGIANLTSYSKSIGVTPKSCNERFFCNTTVNDQLNYLKHLYTLINTLPNGEELASLYINDYHNHLSFDNTYSNLHKYGDTTPYFHDVGIFNVDNPYMIVVLTQEKNNKSIPYANLISDISEKISKLNDLVNLYYN